jgi:hypothetical protein
MIRDAQGKLAITPGAVEKLAIAHAATDFKRDTELGCITAMMIEAAKVALQTGRTPAELAALVRELRICVETLTDDVSNLTRNPENMPGFRMAASALAKSEGV